MAGNDFSREEIVLFDNVLAGFNDACVLTKMASIFQTNQETMERTGDQIWRPQPYIMTSYTGNDMSSNFKDVTQLSVPVSINQQQVVPFVLSARNLRDPQQQGRLQKAAKDKLASDINVAMTTTAALQGSIFIKRTVAATGFDDIALCDSTMTVLGIPMDSRVFGADPANYNNMAANLASRVLDNNKSLKAYEKAMLGEVAGFDSWKLNYGYRLAAKAGVTVAIQDTGDLAYVPVGHTVTAAGISVNVDNRYMDIDITVGSGTVAVGDAFTINAVNAVNHYTKSLTGGLKTFRIVAIVSGNGGSGTVTITPPIIAPNGSFPSTLQYQNVDAAAVDGAALTFLNTVANPVCPFWYADAMEIIPGRLMPAENSGMAVMRGTTDDGIELTMTRQGEINDLSTKYRFDTIFGTACTNPELAGVIAFSQT